MEILCFFAGIAFFYTKAIYPLLLLSASLFLKPNWSVIFWFIAAFALGLSHQYWVSDRGMPDVPVLAKASIEGEVVSIPISSFTKTQFQLQARRLNDQAVDATILLSCYQHCPKFQVGEVWHLQAKLKKPENLANPGSFDFVRGLEARHIRWTGYLKPGASLLSQGDGKPQTILLIREKLAALIESALPSGPALGIFQALTLNVTSHIDKKLWDLFRRTGTTHLMVISGSHIGLIAGFGYWFIKWLWSFSSRLCLYCPATKLASIVALLMALIYALLAGFEPPSQRSLFACFFFFMRNFLSQRFSLWQAWRYGLLLVLLYEPHAVLLPGFYLSFIAVAILFLINQRVSGGSLKKALYIQLACLLGLMPLSLYWFSYGAINGFAANLVAIPLVGFVIVPFALIALGLLYFFDVQLLVYPVKLAIDGLLTYLQWIDSFAGINLDFSYSNLLAPLALMLVMLLLLFLPLRALFPAVVVLTYSAIFPSYRTLAQGEAWIDILDVGQGLAVVVQTAKHILIYDTGMKFYQAGDMAKSVIIPYLNTLGIKKLDKVIISHPDLDHRGGLPSLEEKYPIAELLVDKVSFYHRGKGCHSYPAWVWDGVRFEFLAISQKFRDKNNSSCVLKIQNQAGKVLLTGDIERLAEDYLVRTYGERLRADILLIPHHGSKTSSSLAFIKAVAANSAIISAGFDNRYHFPHKQTIETLQKERVTIYNTADCGMVTIGLNTKINLIKPYRYCHTGSESAKGNRP
ncbi:ComEC family competence protein [Legionella massiliensis]|uniref:ComEC family competence protein n=1 Tax=Legionella massiliensis TaxID=1034943 RepID=A0A078L147_9GAMM|nr:DNA internalization-related competence protein ComEC/Rec2 [Legionella massiliensis]CDZ78937.1 ComEC family competence protein [Legionella massiliensis]CEE14675.1 ComEC family competence protein [Legionella massiliensis]